MLTFQEYLLEHSYIGVILTDKGYKFLGSGADQKAKNQDAVWALK